MPSESPPMPARDPRMLLAGQSPLFPLGPQGFAAWPQLAAGESSQDAGQGPGAQGC